MSISSLPPSKQMGLFAPQAHAALLGADAVLGNLDDASTFSPPPSLPPSASASASAAGVGSAGTAARTPPPMVINKAGSYPLALCCHHAGVPVLVVSSDLKVRVRLKPGGLIVFFCDALLNDRGLQSMYTSLFPPTPKNIMHNCTERRAYTCTYTL